MDMQKKYEKLVEGVKNWAHRIKMTEKKDEVTMEWLKTQVVKVVAEQERQNPGTKLILIDAWCYR